MTARRVRVAAAGDVAPGTMVCVPVHGRRVLIANVDGRFLATDDTCTHEDASLSSGVLHGTVVRCPLHGGSFDLSDGAPVDEPAEEPLATYALLVEGDDLMLELDDE